MAKFDMLSNHKRGLTNSVLGNGMRGGMLGAVAFGGIAAIATIATGGLALPLVAGAAVLGAGAFGMANAAGGALRWGAETIGGLIGTNRKQRPGQDMESEHGQGQQQGMGLAESLVALVGAAMGMKSMKNKISNAFGSPEREEVGQDQGRRGGARDSQQVDPHLQNPMNRPTMPSILQDRMVDGNLQLSVEDLSNPDVRKALDTFGVQQDKHCQALLKSGNPQAIHDAVNIQREASKDYGYDSKSETFVLNPHQPMNTKIFNDVASAGENRQWEQEAEAKAMLKEAKRQGKDLRSGRNDAGVRDPQAMSQAQEASVQSPQAQEPQAQQPQGQSAQAQSVQAEQQQAKTTAPAQQPSASGLEIPGQTAPAQNAPKIEIANGQADVRRALADQKSGGMDAVKALRDSGASVGGSGPVRAGSATNQARPTGPQVGQ